MFRFLRPAIAVLALLPAAGLLPACARDDGNILNAPDSNGTYAAPIGGSPAIANDTSYSEALRCLGSRIGRHHIRIAVGRIADATGAAETRENRSTITQGAALMAVAALAKAGVPMVERLDTSVPRFEWRFLPGRVPGSGAPPSDYYITGGISEVNPQIRTTPDGRSVSSIAVDLRLVDTTTLEVVDVASYQKQIIAARKPFGSAREPVQLAIRSAIERAVLEMLTRLYRVPDSSCGPAAASAEAAPEELPRFFTPYDGAGESDTREPR